jgi:hypothetical protein
MLVPRIGNNPSAEELVPELIADKVKIDTNPSLNFITKNETVFVAELNLTQID